MSIRELIDEAIKEYRDDREYELASALLRVLEDAERMDTALHGVAYYYVSANGVPVERATIRADSSEIKALMEALESHNKLMEELGGE